MRIAALAVASVAALTLAACNNNAEEKAPDASTEAQEAAGIADEAAVQQTVEQNAADAQAAADAAAASEVAQTEPAPATPVEGN